MLTVAKVGWFAAHQLTPISLGNLGVGDPLIPSHSMRPKILDLRIHSTNGLETSSRHENLLKIEIKRLPRDGHGLNRRRDDFDGLAQSTIQGCFQSFAKAARVPG